jgi:hypothetical protein
VAALRDALLSVSRSDVLAWFVHCGYEMA